jgi:hypothetical protein
MKSILLIAPMLSLLMIAATQGELPPLISRDILFGNPERTSPALSPDGKRLADLLQSFLFFEQSPARMRLKPQLCSANKSVLCP